MAEPISERVARRIWQDVRPREDRRPRPPEPILLLTSGVPLSGKTTLARAIVDRLGTATVHVENDAVRAAVVEALDRDGPAFDGRENHLTYETSYAVLDRALEAGYHAIHDATNLTEATRRRAYELADRLGVEVGTAFLVAEDDVLEARAAEADPAGQQAFEALGDREPEPQACTRPKVVLAASASVESNVERVLGSEGFTGLDRAQNPARP